MSDLSDLSGPVGLVECQKAELTKRPVIWYSAGVSANTIAMKYLTFFLALLANNSLLALPNFDPFADATANGGTSYAVDSPLAPQNDNAGNNWVLVGSVNPANPQPMIVAGNLSYADLPPSKGNSVSFAPSPPSGQTARLGLNLTNTPSIVYYSFILKVTDLAAVPTTNNNNFFAGFSDTVGAQSATLSRCSGRLVAKRSGAGYVLGIGKGSTASEFAYDATVRNIGEVLFVAVAYERVGLATNVNLWVNPPASSFGSNAPPAANATITSGSTAGEISANSARAFVISCQTATAPSGIIDELRIATNWAYVSGGDPAILINPVNRTVPPGGTAIFSVTARGTPSLTYQWVKDGTTLLSDGGNISGATTATLTVNNVSAPDVGAYSVLVTNGTGNFAQSGSASLSIMDPAITAQPQDRTNDFGTTASFQVTVSGTSPFSFQ